MAQYSEEEHPFYGIEVIRRNEEKYIKNVLKKYQNDTADDLLKEKIWDELQMEKYKGNITIPFKVVLRCDALKKFPNYVEVILDTKV